MYKIIKRMEIAGSHKLELDYESKCRNTHGHNWIIYIHCKAEELNHNGMLIDFTHLKQQIHDRLDHQHINKVVNVNPTAENIAKWIYDRVELAYKVEVQESEGNVAIYEE